MQVWLIALALEVALLSVVTLAMYAWDKRQAGRRGWRIPEKRLHVLALLGGWPGALIGQRLLGHKTIKKRFRTVFWLSVLGHLAIAGAVTYVVWTLNASR